MKKFHSKKYQTSKTTNSTQPKLHHEFYSQKHSDSVIKNHKKYKTNLQYSKPKNN